MTIQEKLLTVNEFSRPGRGLKAVLGLVLHWTADPGASALHIRNFFEGRKHGQSGHGGTHYVVGLDGEVFRMIPENEMAYHVGSESYTEYGRGKFGAYPNNSCLGVEMCVRDAEGSYTPQTWQSAVALCAEVCRRHDLEPFRDITTHQAIVGWKICPKWMRDHPEDLELFRAEVSASLGQKQ